MNERYQITNNNLVVNLPPCQTNTVNGLQYHSFLLQYLYQYVQPFSHFSHISGNEDGLAT